jgi:hypothetical protein
VLTALLEAVEILSAVSVMTSKFPKFTGPVIPRIMTAVMLLPFLDLYLVSYCSVSDILMTDIEKY